MVVIVLECTIAIESITSLNITLYVIVFGLLFKKLEDWGPYGPPTSSTCGGPATLKQSRLVNVLYRASTECTCDSRSV